MTRDDAKAVIYNTQKVGDVYFIMDLINEIYDDFEEELTIANEKIEKAIETVATEMGEY